MTRARAAEFSLGPLLKSCSERLASFCFVWHVHALRAGVSLVCTTIACSQLQPCPRKARGHGTQVIRIPLLTWACANRSPWTNTGCTSPGRKHGVPGVHARRRLSACAEGSYCESVWSPGVAKHTRRSHTRNKQVPCHSTCAQVSVRMKHVCARRSSTSSGRRRRR